jgi:hypothetical protein
MGRNKRLVANLARINADESGKIFATQHGKAATKPYRGSARIFADFVRFTTTGFVENTTAPN